MRKSVLLVTAHPDDECMFFTPSIRNFINEGSRVDLLCLSTGNYDGMGQQRRGELERSCSILGISSVFIIEDENLQDGPRNTWKPETIRKHIESLKTAYSIILTFDDEGVSGHPNHCAISKALTGYSRCCWKLKSLPVWLKYLGLIGVWITRVLYTKNVIKSLSLRDAYRYGYIAMTQHESQLVWFRRLYLIFSVYMFCNILVKPDDHSK